jgi:hypothetical protein
MLIRATNPTTSETPKMIVIRVRERMIDHHRKERPRGRE